MKKNKRSIIHDKRKVRSLPFEVWREIKFDEDGKDAIFNGRYMVSSLGRVKSKIRLVARKSFNNSDQVFYRAERVMSWRKTGTKSLVKQMQLHATDEYGNTFQKTIYDANIVASYFLEPSKDPNKNKATIIDPNKPVSSDNVMWCDQSFLSTRIYKDHPHLINGLRDRNIESGYYESDKLKKHIDEIRKLRHKKND